MMTRTTGLFGAGLGLAVTLAFAGGVQGQTDTEAWYPFLGCWAPESGVGPTVCFRPTTEGVEVARVAEGQVVSRDSWSTRAEGVRSEREGCEGLHHARFSADRNRIFLSSSYDCEGGRQRHETGVLALSRGEELIDVRSVDIEVDEPVAWVQRYRAVDPSVGQEAGLADMPVPGMALETARRGASARIDIDDVVEAVDQVGPGALEAWVAESGTAFRVDGDVLVTLADRGVPAEVLDLMIAVSYPDRFALAVDDRGVSPEAIASPGGRVGVGPASARCYGSGYGYGYGWSDPLLYGRYNPYAGCGNGYRYSRYSYGPYGYGSGWYGYYNPRVIVVDPGEGQGTSNPGARAVRGRGYTRGASDGTATGAASTGSTPTRSGGAASSGTGGSRGTTEPARRAKPRGGGGGGL